MLENDEKLLVDIEVMFASSFLLCSFYFLELFFVHFINIIYTSFVVNKMNKYRYEIVTIPTPSKGSFDKIINSISNKSVIVACDFSGSLTRGLVSFVSKLKQNNKKVTVVMQKPFRLLSNKEKNEAFNFYYRETKKVTPRIIVSDISNVYPLINDDIKLDKFIELADNYFLIKLSETIQKLDYINEKSRALGVVFEEDYKKLFGRKFSLGDC